MTTLHTSDLTDSPTAESGPDRGAGPAIGSSAAPLDAELMRYAESKARQALSRYAGIRRITIALARGADSATCRLYIVLEGVPAVSVAHTAPAMLYAIDTAIEMAAHLIAARRDSIG